MVNPGTTGLQKKDLISEEQFFEILATLPDNHDDLEPTDKRRFVAQIGGDAIKSLLKQVDVGALAAELRAQILEETSVQKKQDALKRLRVVEAFRESEAGPLNRPEWMVLDIIPVIPPELRPLVPLEGGRFATSDLNDLYRRVIQRNDRLAKLVEVNTEPAQIVAEEMARIERTVGSERFADGRFPEARELFERLSTSRLGARGWVSA